MRVCCEIDSPLGPMILAAEQGAMVGAWFVGQRYFPPNVADWAEDANEPVLVSATAQLAQYFNGSHRAFDLPLKPVGTMFQKEVWRALSQLACGATTSYGRLARQLNRSSASRAVGAAVGRNPISVIIPCHRVLGHDGSLTGYAGGLARKRRLLFLESD